MQRGGELRRIFDHSEPAWETVKQNHFPQFLFNLIIIAAAWAPLCE